MLKDFNVVIKISYEEIIIECGCSARKGDNLDGTLFISATKLAAEAILTQL